MTKSIDIVTREYELSHGCSPRGRGSWAFVVVDGSCNREVETVFTPGMTYSDAKVWAKAYVRKHYAAEIATGWLYLSVGA